MFEQIPTRKKRKQPEASDQIKLAAWIAKNGIRFTASAAGGKRNLLEGLKFKRMGVSKGFPDIHIPYPRKGFHGLYIELKPIKGGRASSEQIDWIDFLRQEGYCADFCYGFDEAVGLIESYFDMNETAA